MPAGDDTGCGNHFRCETALPRLARNVSRMDYDEGIIPK